MTNFEVIVKEHPQFVKECLAHTRVEGVLKAVVKGSHEHDSWYDKDKDRDEMNFLNAEYVQPVLDNIEKKYLSDVIRPFEDRVESIRKVATTYNGRYFIEINMKEVCDHIRLPYFYKNTRMYTGMKENKTYTLEELGL